MKPLAERIREAERAALDTGIAALMEPADHEPYCSKDEIGECPACGALKHHWIRLGALLALRKKEACPGCDGSGRDALTGDDCDACKGSGEAHGTGEKP